MLFLTEKEKSHDEDSESRLSFLVRIKITRAERPSVSAVW